MTNEEWYYYDTEDSKYKITDKAKNSYKEIYDSFNNETIII